MLKVCSLQSLTRFGAVAAIALAAWAPTSAHADLADAWAEWSISGPGLTSATGSNGIWDLTYEIDFGSGGSGTWLARSTATAAGDYEFAWTYTGHHDNIALTAFLLTEDPHAIDQFLVLAGPEVSGGFGFGGTYKFENVQIGDVFGFDFGGATAQYNLDGHLHLVQTSPVPEPATLALFGFGLMGLGALTRKRAAAVRNAG